MLFLGKLNAQIIITLVNEDSKEPARYATIELQYLKQTKFAISDTNGKAVIDTNQLEKIIISKVGFANREFSIAQIRTSNLVFTLIPHSKTLETIAVISKKPLVQSDVSSITYDVSRDSTLLKSNAAEAISRLPFISIDPLSNLSYKNNREFLVLVNGSRFGILTDNPTVVLKSIPATMVQSVELIFDPPLEYRMRGYEAVINIKTKPGYYKGTLGAIQASYNTIGKFTTTPFLSWQHNQTYLQVSAELRNDDVSKAFTSELRSDSLKTRIIQSNQFRTTGTYKKIGISLDQRLKSSSRIGVYLTLYENHFTNQGISNIIKEVSGSSENIKFPTMLSNRANYLDLGADYNHKYGKRLNNYSILVKYLTESSTIKSNSTQKTDKRDNLIQKPAELTFQGTNTLNLRNKMTLETVVKYIHRRSTSAYSEDTLMSDHWSAIKQQPSQLFQFDIGNFNNSLIIRSNKVSARLGLNLDYAVYQTTDINSHETKNAFNILPYGSARFVIKKRRFLDLGYSAGLYRPTFLNLARAVPNFDPLTRKKGNAQLGTNIMHRLTSEYSWYFGKQNSSLYAQINFDFSNTALNSFSSFDSAANTRVISYRQSKYRGINFNLGGNFDLSEKITSDVFLLMGIQEFGDNISRNPVFEISNSSSYSISKTTGAQFSLSYRSRNISSMGYTKEPASYSLNFYKRFQENKLVLSLLASNFFQKDQEQKELITGTHFSTITRNITPYRAFRLTLNWRFGNLKTFEMKVKTLSNTDTKRLD